MQGIILAAGRGTRLADSTGGRPKALVEVAGSTILERQMANLRAVWPDLDEVTVVVGYCAGDVEAVGGPALRYVVNDQYAETNTAASLELALRRDGQDALLLNGDVVLDRTALEVTRAFETGAVCEFKDEVVPEEVQVILDGDGRSVSTIGKAIGGVAEAVGIYRLERRFIAAYLEHFSPADDRLNYYEDVFNRIIGQGVHTFASAPLAPGLAVEVDTPDDLAKAEQAIADAR